MIITAKIASIVNVWGKFSLEKQPPVGVLSGELLEVNKVYNIFFSLLLRENTRIFYFYLTYNTLFLCFWQAILEVFSSFCVFFIYFS